MNYIIENRNRSAKTTTEQYKYYLDFLETNDILQINRTSPASRSAVTEAYGQLAMGLNSMDGPIQNVQGWKKIFAAWRNQTTRKARKITSFQQNDRNIPISMTLTELEERLLTIILPRANADIHLNQSSSVNANGDCNKAAVNESNLVNMEEIPAKRCKLEETQGSTRNLLNKTTLEKGTQTSIDDREEYGDILFQLLSKIDALNDVLSDISKAAIYRTRLNLAIAKAAFPDLEIKCDMNNLSN